MNLFRTPELVELILEHVFKPCMAPEHINIRRVCRLFRDAVNNIYRRRLASLGPDTVQQIRDSGDLLLLWLYPTREFQCDPRTILPFDRISKIRDKTFHKYLIIKIYRSGYGQTTYPSGYIHVLRRVIAGDIIIAGDEVPHPLWWDLLNWIADNYIDTFSYYCILFRRYRELIKFYSRFGARVSPQARTELFQLLEYVRIKDKRVTRLRGYLSCRTKKTLIGTD